jgi:transcription-repair coupling factor (superfamily II helicase)
LSFRDNIFAKPAGLIAYIRDQAPMARVRPDQRGVVVMDDWETPEERLKGAVEILRSLVAIAEKGKKAA